MIQEFWSRGAKRAIHPEDESHLRLHDVLDWVVDDSLSHKDTFDSRKDLHRKIHRNLYPQPFIGNVENATVYILYGNPGFAVTDYVDELKNEKHAQAITNSLTGLGSTFYPLEAASEGTGVADYWRPRLEKLILLVSSNLDIQYEDAKEIVSHKVCLLESGAYHSKSAPPEWVDNLPSSRMARDFAKNVVSKRARANQAFVLVWRRANYWQLEESANISIRGNPRLSHLRENERLLMLKFLRGND